MVRLCCSTAAVDAYMGDAELGEARDEASYAKARKELNLYTTTL